MLYLEHGCLPVLLKTSNNILPFSGNSLVIELKYIM